jgi:catechol 2,3-dioxygenase-like lactoylglutathione lyase family enzyme
MNETEPTQRRNENMQFRLTNIHVQDQDGALRFYTDVLGFVKGKDISMGQYRFLTVFSPEGAAGVELVLEPTTFQPALTFQKARFEAGIPAAAFITQDVGGEYGRLKARGVKFRGEPRAMGPITAVLFEDTCGNLINLVQPPA